MPSARDRRRMHLEQRHDHVAYAISSRIQVVGEVRRVSTPTLPVGGAIEWTTHVEQFAGAGVKWDPEFVPDQEATSSAAAPPLDYPFWRPADDTLRDGRLFTMGDSAYTTALSHSRPIPAGNESFAARTEPPGIHSLLLYIVARAPIPGAPGAPSPDPLAPAAPTAEQIGPTRRPAAPPIPAPAIRRDFRRPTFIGARAAT